uniref:SAM domain-containing protein n=2 Tax=Caenorhabditis tropicalis TaxID=1561998 RepID=A0A1I7UXA5_9PELO
MMDCPVYFTDEQEEERYRIACLAHEITGFEMEYPYLQPHARWNSQPITHPHLFRAKEEVVSEPEEEKEEEPEPRLTGILRKPSNDSMKSQQKSVSFAANTVERESTTRIRKSKRKNRTSRGFNSQRYLCGPFSRLGTGLFDEPKPNDRFMRELERMFGSSFRPKILNPAIIEVIPPKPSDEPEDPVVEKKPEELVPSGSEEKMEDHEETAFGEVRQSDGNIRKLPESQELFLPIGATNNWKLWTKDEVLQWSSSFLDAPSFIRKMRKLGLNGETLEYLVESKEWKDVDLSFHMYAQLRMHLNKVINDFTKR